MLRFSAGCVEMGHRRWIYSHVSLITGEPIPGLSMINSDLLADWRPFFLMVAGASASLTGLLFVAMSLHVRHIATQPLYRYRARLSLGSLMAILMISGLILLANAPRLPAPEPLLDDVYAHSMEKNQGETAQRRDETASRSRARHSFVGTSMQVRTRARE